MLDRHRYFWALLLIGAPAAAYPSDQRGYAEPGQTVAAAAMTIAARFGVITSTFRTAEHNRAVGGVPDSYHLLGRAIDIVRRPGVSHAQIAAAFTAAGFHLVESLDEGDHSHFAFGLILHQAALALPPPPQASPKSQLAADHHGDLRLDLGGQPGGPETGPHSSGGRGRAVH